ncbi:hypothetical protein EXIGLDRAFT_736615 [Exidia glandulosa HHB12029]|uniref:F-box domain-containing protein n=1 Tax=Exidia glandulosa HHB12029 TaxID=1314781 RepID=A0A166ARW7_EXIGL|nr:hypothetical protein EXIGLDRAFT_736615 [Exidia glandulosa HHB12029]
MTDYSDRVPDEVLSKIFDFASHLEIVYASATCRRWRAVATDHPTYWTISLQTTSPQSIALFIGRLDRSHSRPITLLVLLSTSRYRAVYTSQVLPDAFFEAIGRHIHHTKALRLRIPFENAEALMTALQSPAPILELLAVDFYRGGRRHVILHPDLFGKNALKLRSLQLRNTIPHPQASWLAQVEHLTITFRSDASAWEGGPPVVFPRLLSLRRLTLAGHIPVAYLATTPWAQLDELLINEFEYHSPDWSLWRSASLANIPYVGTDFVNNEIVSIISNHLQGSLALTLGIEPGPCFFARFQSRSDGRQRIIRESATTNNGWGAPRTGWDGRKPPPHDLFSRPALMHRVAHLVMPAALWPRLSGYFTHLPDLTDLLIPLHSARELSYFGDDAKPLRCPALFSVTFIGNHSGRNVVRVPSEAFTRFMDAFIDCPISTQQHFENIQVAEDTYDHDQALLSSLDELHIRY